MIIWSLLVCSAGQHLVWDEAVIPSCAQRCDQTTKQPPDYRASPDFCVRPIGLFEIWRSAILVLQCMQFCSKHYFSAAVLQSMAVHYIITVHCSTIVDCCTELHGNTAFQFSTEVNYSTAVDSISEPKFCNLLHSSTGVKSTAALP